jgi:uncharacterized membrane protein
MGGFDFWTVLGHILVVLLIIWVVVRLIAGRRWHRGMMGGRGMWHAHSAIATLNDRYAKGEITKEDYEERKKTLLGQ